MSRQRRPDPRVARAELKDLTLGGATGTYDERALLHVLLSRAWDPGLLRRGGAHTLLRGDAGVVSWERALARQADTDLSMVIDPFRAMLTGELRDEFTNLADGRRWRSPSTELRRRARALIGDLRHLLARTCIQLLTPDLVILDEFQRFPHLLEAGEESDEATLAQLLFDQPGVRVLLLSATRTGCTRAATATARTTSPTSDGPPGSCSAPTVTAPPTH